MNSVHNTAPESLTFSRTPCFLVYDSDEYKEYKTHWHNAVEIIMPTENVFPVVCENNQYTLKENNILIIPAGHLHNLKAQKGRRIIMLCDNMMLKDNPAMGEINMLLSEPILIDNSYSTDLTKELCTIISDMKNTFENNAPFCETMLYQKLISLFLKILEYEKFKGVEENKYSDKIGLIRKYIDTYFASPITLDSMANAIGYSKFHLSRLLSANGVSFTDMLNSRRIKAAEVMLHDESCSITQACMNTGFTSITTFNRAFKKHKMCTPTEFREMYRDKNI